MFVEGSCGSNYTNTVVNSSTEGNRQEAWPIVVGIFGAVALGLLVVFVLVYKTCRSDTHKHLHTQVSQTKTCGP